MKKKLRVIINPFSGIGQKKIVPRLLEKGLNKDQFDWDIVFTERAKHAVEISKEAVRLNFDAVVAVGGDGSVNEIARNLIHTNTALGIIPAGSGNGVARSLSISLNIQKAIDIINEFKIIKIDTGLLNDHPFVGVAGIGFDAMISHEFANRKLRGKMSYGYLILKKLKAFPPMNVQVKGSTVFQTSKAMVLTFANTSQYGNNAYIAPTAVPTDGHLKLSVIDHFKNYQLPDIAVKMLRKKILGSSKVSYMEFDEIEVKHESKFAHIDGEPIEVPNKIIVKVIPSSLNVISPQ